MMNTPILDFVRGYNEKSPLRLHMPGHKGVPLLGFEALDITEFDGADDLFCPDGIIAESEKNASEIFGAHTFYSTGGSTLAIQTMLRLFLLYSNERKNPPKILAARNVHKAFLNAAALLGIDVDFLYPQKSDSYYSCRVTKNDVERALSGDSSFGAVYITSPDYVGNISDIKGISSVCKKHGVMLLVDNAHGAYLKFLNEDMHPVSLGADMCCDSAHKTLPALTGGAYLHISKDAPNFLLQSVKASMALFSTSSPSYLIMQSLDALNPVLCGFKKTLSEFTRKIDGIKQKLISHGFSLFGDEPLKITLAPKSFGYTGDEIAEILEKNEIYPEFHDPDFAVLMPTPYNTDDELLRLLSVLLSIKKRAPVTKLAPPLFKPKRVLNLREALLSSAETVDIDNALGRICAVSSVSCPPAVPIALSGEIIDSHTVKCFKYYGIKQCSVVKIPFKSSFDC